MSDDDLVRKRIEGKSVRAIAKDKGIALADVNRALDRFTNDTVSDQARKHTLALELARLDELQEVFYRQAMYGDVHSAQLVTKIIERRCVMLGLHAPQQAVLQIVEASAPRETSTDKIKAALNGLLEDGRRNGPGDPH